ncbi:hypothetical protein [Thermomonas sp. HDW16]|uniref:hypothetical protein n=1 Tax=Thermomonas sp. HDW16 TaxID=2714945 RepID=UPI00140D08AF|nr:hypothetical protein [Thermomonas sp. HDW16]QIL20504.1 hypothetical protein G7079_07035 [Thermomonas sp. HDW16]
MSSILGISVSNRGYSLLQRTLLIVLAIYLSLAWFGGGPTVDVGSTDEWLMLLAVPVIVMSASSILFAPAPPRLTCVASLAALAVLAVPLLQLLPLPESVWEWSSAREGVAKDLLIAGVGAGRAPGRYGQNRRSVPHWHCCRPWPAFGVRSLWAEC